jgi:hypothetical protein
MRSRVSYFGVSAWYGLHEDIVQVTMFPIATPSANIKDKPFQNWFKYSLWEVKKTLQCYINLPSWRNILIYYIYLFVSPTHYTVIILNEN